VCCHACHHVSAVPLGVCLCAVYSPVRTRTADRADFRKIMIAAILGTTSGETLFDVNNATSRELLAITLLKVRTRDWCLCCS
jgi:hypothetical protein